MEENLVGFPPRTPFPFNDAPEGRKLLEKTALRKKTRIVMDKGYADFKTRSTVRECGCIPVVPPKCNMKKPWRYDKKLYRKRNEIERLFHHLKKG